MSKTISLANLGGLTVGISVVLVIALWTADEFSYERQNPNYPYIARVMQNQVFNSKVESEIPVSIPLKNELKNKYGDRFKYIILSWWTTDHVLSTGQRAFSESGKFMEPMAAEMLSLEMVLGSRNGLQDPSSILISETVSQKLFDKENPIGKVIKIDNQMAVRIAGVYKDIAHNSIFNKVAFISPWQLFIDHNEWAKNDINNWDDNSFELFVQVSPEQDINKLSSEIKEIKNNSLKLKGIQPAKQETIFLHSMARWHLYSSFSDGKNTGGENPVCMAFRYHWHICSDISLYQFYEFKYSQNRKSG